MNKMISVRTLYNNITDKEVYLYGAGRAALDFSYIFPQLSVKGVIPARGEQAADSLKSMSVDLQQLNIGGNIFLILCTYYREEAENELKQRGFCYGQDYVDVLEVVRLLDFPMDILAGERKVVLYEDVPGFRQYYGDDFADEIAQIIDSANYYLIPSMNGWKKIVESMEQEGLVYGRDFFAWNRKGEWPSELYEKMFHTKPREIPLCKYPFSECMEVFPNGGCYSCCINWLTLTIGSIACGTLQSIWTSPRARLIQLSMINRTYAFCDIKVCQRMLQYYDTDSIREIDSIIREDDYRLQGSNAPKEISIAIDNTCNLYCPSCRSHRMVATGEEKAGMMRMAEKIRKDFLPQVQAVKLAGTGEVFASEVYRSILYGGDKKIKKLTLLTNGQLFTPQNFERLEPLYDEISMDVSIDGVSKEIYEKTRRGGRWEVICQNMEYASELKKQGRLKRIQFNYVFSKINYKEMPDYIRWAETLGVDSINFMRILHMPHAMTKEEYDEITLFRDDGSLKEEYKEFFKDEIFLHPIVCKETLPI